MRTGESRCDAVLVADGTMVAPKLVEAIAAVEALVARRDVESALQCGRWPRARQNLLLFARAGSAQSRGPAVRSTTYAAEERGEVEQGSGGEELK